MEFKDSLRDNAKDVMAIINAVDAESPAVDDVRDEYNRREKDSMATFQDFDDALEFALDEGFVGTQRNGGKKRLFIKA